MNSNSPISTEPPPRRKAPPRVGGAAAATCNRRGVYCRDASIELILEPSGRLRRFVVLASEKSRIALEQPRRREIEPLHAQQEHFHLRTSELWALAEHQARTSLRLLYSRLE